MRVRVCICTRACVYTRVDTRMVNSRGITRIPVFLDDLEEGESDDERGGGGGGGGDPGVERHVGQLIDTWRRTQRRTQVIQKRPTNLQKRPTNLQKRPRPTD